MFFNTGYDLGLFQTTDKATSYYKDIMVMNKIVSFVNKTTKSLNKSLKIINYVSESRINGAVMKFLNKSNSKFLDVDFDFKLSNQILLQLGIMPKP